MAKLKKDLKVGDYTELLEHLEPTHWYEGFYSKFIKWPLINFKYWFKSQVYQRLRYGFPLEDTWSFYVKHAKWCVPRLKRYRQSIFGYSGWLCSDNDFNQKKFGFYTEMETYEYNQKKWREILDKIIWSFENVDNEVYPIKPPDYDGRWIVLAIDEKGEITYGPADKRPWDYRPCIEHKKKVQEGIDLFAKYYMSIWD